MSTVDIELEAKTMLAIKFYNFPEVIMDTGTIVESMELDQDKIKTTQAMFLTSGDRVKFQIAENLSAIFVVHHIDVVNVERCVG